MKKYFVIAALCAAALAVSCEKDPAAPERGTVRTFTCLIADSPDTRISISDQGKTAWEAGDEILIHGKWAGGQYSATVTLTASDISADGKTATFDVEEYTAGSAKENDGLSDVYALYPASAAAVDNGNTNWRSTNKFSNSNLPLMSGYNLEEGGTTLVFHNLCGIITFSVKGNFNRYEFSGNGSETVGYNGYASRLYQTADGPKTEWVKEGSALTKTGGELDGSLETVNYICIPGGVNLTEGFTFRFYDDDDLLQVATSVAPVEVPRGSLLPLGNITSHLKDYVPPTSSDHKSDIPMGSATDLSAAGGTANCYVVTAPGTYKFPAMRGNSETPAGNVFGVQLLWETCNGEEEVTAGSVISAVDFEDDWICFKTPDTLMPGNALIAARDATDNIIWSWHIWIPASAIQTFTEEDFIGTPIMDRNLGALSPATTSAAATVETFGMYYQWGRKDPFPGSVAVAATLDFATVDGEQSTGWAISNPTTLPKVYEGDSGGNWNTADADLWDSDKTEFDPCPPGYKVPYYDESLGLWERTGDGWTFDYDLLYFKRNSSSVVFPLAGYISGGTDASYVGTRSLILSAKRHSSPRGYVKLIRQDKGGYYYHNYFKMEGGSVRCIVE